MQARFWVVCSLLSLLPASSLAQAPVYDIRALECDRFAESVLGQVESRVGSERRQESFGRDGVLVVRASADSNGLQLEAWFDSLAVYREGPEGRDEPATDGIVGGRYRGTLDPTGDYLALTAPFVPAALRNVFDFARLPLHFFPPLPPVALRPGADWSDGAELTIWRLADSAGTSGAVQRYQWIRREEWDEGVAVGDSTMVVHRTEREDGRLAWLEGSGPAGWESSVVATLEVGGGAGQSEVRQEVRVQRLPRDCGAE